jgi:type II secretory pathway pseudopilin PulG
MKLSHLIKSQSGFSLIESMVAGSILLGAIFAGMKYLDNQTTQKKILETQANERALALQVSASLVSSSSKYPPLYLAGGNMIYYVGCFNVKGQQGLNYQGRRDYAFYSGPTSEPEAPTGVVCNGESSPLADKFSKYEVQVWWSDVSNRVMTFKIFDLTGHSPVKRILKYRVAL